MKREYLDTFFSGLSALCAVIGIVVLLWGAFFTSLPEKLISELNTDIKKQKETQIDLIQANRELRGGLKELRELNDAIEAENESLQSNISLLKAEKKKYEGELAQYRSKLASTDVAELQNLLLVFGLSAGEELTELEKEAKLGASYFEMLQWLKDEPQQPKWPDHNNFRFQKKYDAAIQEYKTLRAEYDAKVSEWDSIKPDDGDNYNTLRFLELCADCEDLEKYGGMDYKEFWQSNISERAGRAPKTAKDFFIKHGKTVAKDRNKRVQEKFSKLLERYISENANVFELSLQASYPEKWAAREVIEKSKVALKNISATQEALGDFIDILSEQEI